MIFKVKNSLFYTPEQQHSVHVLDGRSLAFCVYEHNAMYQPKTNDIRFLLILFYTHFFFSLLLFDVKIKDNVNIKLANEQQKGSGAIFSAMAAS